MSRKIERSYDDFRELGEYLYLAREALVSAEVKAANMYPKSSAGEKQSGLREIEQIRKRLDDLRCERDGRWEDHLTGRPPRLYDAVPKYPFYPAGQLTPEADETRGGLRRIGCGFAGRRKEGTA